MTERDDTVDSPAPAEIESALARILGQVDAGFGARSRAFLQFIVSESLAGRASRLKAFTIALAVFERDASFDPQTNSIVRVEATRLRRWLERYYAAAGAADPIVIQIPRGGYAPEFSRRTNAAGPKPEITAEASPLGTEELPVEIAPAEVTRAVTVDLRIQETASPKVELAASIQAARPPWLRRPFVLAGAVFTLALVSLGLVAARFGASPRLDEFPVGSIKPARLTPAAFRPSIRVALDAYAGGEDERRFATVLQSRIEIALSRFDELTVVDPSQPDDRTTTRADYRLTGVVMPLAAGHVSVFIRLSQAASSTIVWSREFSDVSTEMRTEGAAALVRDLVTPLAQPYGVIFADLRQRAAHGDLPLGMNCFITAADSWKLATPEADAAARRCMGQVVLADPAFAPAYAKLAELYLVDYLNGPSPPATGKPLLDADDAARRAVELAPESAKAQSALFEVDLFEHKLDEAFRLGRHALDLNPLDTDIMARVGAALAGRGDFEQGLPLLHRAVELNPAYPGWIAFYFFLDAHLRGDATGARQAIVASHAAVFPLGLAARIISDDESNEADQKHRDIAELVAKYPDFAEHPRAWLERFALAPPIVERLASELRHARLDEAAAPPEHL